MANPTEQYRGINPKSESRLQWQSKLVLLTIMPFAGVSALLQLHWWAIEMPSVALWAAGLSVLLGLVAWKLRTATPWAAVSGTVIASGLAVSTAVYPYAPWHTALIPLIALLVLTAISTRIGRLHKERLGTAEKRRGRSASQVAANLGVAVLVLSEVIQTSLADTHWFLKTASATFPLFAVGLAALAESAADTVSSELGQVFGGTPRMITTLRSAEPGTDGAVSVVGTLLGIASAGLVALAGTWALRGGVEMFWIATAGGVFGLLFDSLLGATLERKKLLNNDAVNFLSTVSAAAVALALLAFLARA
jgi:uncharacterized protein (TIGR00297 family)